MKTTITMFNYQTIGTKVGRIWDGTIIEKEFNINFTRDKNYPYVPYFASLEAIREHIVHDKDFQDCEIIEQLLICTTEHKNKTIQHKLNIK